MYHLLGFGYHNIGAWMIDSLSALRKHYNELVSNQILLAGGLGVLNGLAILAKCLINFL